MTQTEQTIEVEVVEIDGVSVEPRPVQEKSGNGKRVDWRAWQGRVKRLDARWWPLWVALGFVFLVIAVAFIMCAAVLVVCYRIIAGLGQAFVSLFQTPESQIRTR